MFVVALEVFGICIWLEVVAVVVSFGVGILHVVDIDVLSRVVVFVIVDSGMCILLVGVLVGCVG